MGYIGSAVMAFSLVFTAMGTAWGDATYSARGLNLDPVDEEAALLSAYNDFHRRASPGHAFESKRIAWI